MPLRPSQVETLRAVDRLDLCAAGAVAPSLKRTTASVRRSLLRLANRGYVAKNWAYDYNEQTGCWAFSLTQLGREALKESGWR